uniref:Uncharacterized protein n=1 Tax=Sipha flava TaxID=143950 RepID=A0A2S2QGM5_9HEMI
MCVYIYIYIRPVADNVRINIDEKLRSFTCTHRISHKRTQDSVLPRARILRVRRFECVYDLLSPPPSEVCHRHRRRRCRCAVTAVRARLNTDAAGGHAYPVDLYASDWMATRTREQPPACSARAPPIISACENPTRTT